MRNRWLMFVLSGFMTTAAFGQITPAAGSTPPDDTPSYKVGATIFADFTYQQSPETTDAAGNRVNATSFNVPRAYINITGNLNHLIAFRVTPDVARESGSGSSLNGSIDVRLKYAYGQLNLDDWTTKGSWVRFGLQQTPYLDYTEGIYHYRFQGTLLVDREGYVSSADSGISGHYNFPGNHGDVQGGFFNGESYSKAETNDQKAFQVRASYRPLPLGGLWKGLRVTGFVVADHYFDGAKRQRVVGQITYEHPRGNAGVEYLKASDQSSPTVAEVKGSGYSVWATPKLGGRGWELLLRRDSLEPDDTTSQRRTRNIAGVAYWVPNLNKVSAAVLFDYDSLHQRGYATPRPDDTRYGVKMLINF